MLAIRRAACRLAVGLLVLLAFPRSALGDSRSFALSSSSSAEPPCFTPEALENAVAARLGRDPFVPAERADIIVDVRELPSTAGRHRARVGQHAHGGRLLGERALEAESCVELMSSTTFVVVLIVDPDAAFGDPSPERPAVTPRPPAPAVSRRRKPPPPVRRQPTVPRLHAGAAVTYGRGLLPGGDVGGLLMLGISPWRLPVHLEWRGSYRVSLEAPRGRDFAALAQEWRACFLVRPHASLGGSACAGGSWSAILPVAREGLTDGDLAAKTVYGPVLALGPTLRAGGFAVVGDVSVFFPRPRWEFSALNEAGQQLPIYELERIVVSVTIGMTRAF